MRPNLRVATPLSTGARPWSRVVTRMACPLERPPCDSGGLPRVYARLR
jgi:hypothetical protein